LLPKIEVEILQPFNQRLKPASLFLINASEFL